MNIFVPYNIESRKDKLIQANLKLLQSEVFEEGLHINNDFNFTADQVKVRTIKGYTSLKPFLGYIPEWLKNVKIEGNFDISHCDLYSLENIPHTIEGNFNCSRNKQEFSIEYIKSLSNIQGNIKN